MRFAMLVCTQPLTLLLPAGFALSAAMVTHWIFNFAIGQLFLPAVTNFGISKVYLFFTAVCYATVIFARSQLIETKGRSLEEIEAAMSA